MSVTEDNGLSRAPVLAELARELGVSVGPSTILRWVIRYVPEFEKCWQAYERPVGRFMAEWTLTYLKVGGQWMYLYRAVDKQSNTVESYLQSNAGRHRRQGLL